MEETLKTILLIFAIYFISAIPLYFAVLFFRGKTSILKVAIINMIVAIITIAVKLSFDRWEGLLAFVIMLLMYRTFFRLSFIKALLAWLLQFVVAAFLIMLFTGIGWLTLFSLAF